MENKLLEVDSIHKYFGDKLLLSNIYLKCRIGDVIGVFGRNGSGKTTLFKIIFGIFEAENKFIRINNQVVDKPFLLKNAINYLPQDNFIPTNFRVKKAIDMYVSTNQIKEFYTDELINKFLFEKISNLSGGELKYLQVKLILNSDADFCLLDEPYSGLSPVMIDKINQLIIYKSKTKGIIVADHLYRDVLKVANKIYLLKDGAGKLLNSKEDLIEHGYLTVGML